MKKISRKVAEGICDRDKECTRAHAHMYGWCRECECITLCPYKEKYKKKTDNDMKKVRRNDE